MDFKVNKKKGESKDSPLRYVYFFLLLEMCIRDRGKTYWVGSHKLLKDFSATVSDVMADMLVHYESDGNGRCV